MAEAEKVHEANRSHEETGHHGARHEVPAAALLGEMVGAPQISEASEEGEEERQQGHMDETGNPLFADKGVADREQLKALLQEQHPNVRFTRVFLMDRDILKGFRVGRWVRQLLLNLADEAVEHCEEMDEVVLSARAGAAEIQQAAADMGWDEAAIPVSFGNARKSGAGRSKTKRSSGGQHNGNTGRGQKQNNKRRKKQHGRRFSVGDMCECYFDADGLYYPARVDSDDGAHATVSFLGYDDSRQVPWSFLRPLSGGTVDVEAVVGTEGNGTHVRFDEDGEPNDTTSLDAASTERLGLAAGAVTVPHGAEDMGGGGIAHQAPRDSGFAAAFEEHGEGQGNDTSTDGASAVAASDPGAGVLRKEKGQNGGSHGVFTADGNDEAPPEGVSRKYWMQRFRYFSQFERGIKLDDEGWYSVTPERIASHQARRIACGVAVDLFAGCGGNVIQLAHTCQHVIAVDIDEQRLRHAKHNAAVYGVTERVEFLCGDALSLMPSLERKVDVVFMSPPWGGPEYLNLPEYKLEHMKVGDVDGRGLLEMAMSVCEKVVVMLPRNVSYVDIVDVAAGRAVEIEENMLNYKMKTVTVYIGNGYVACEDIGAKEGNNKKSKKISS